MCLCGSSFVFLILNWEQNKIEGVITVKIPKGKTLKEITGILSKKNIVKSDRSFMLAVRSLGYEKDIQAGNLVLHKPKTNFRLIHQLVDGMPELIKITILEGWNIYKVATTLENTLGIHQDKVISLCMNKRFIQSLGIKAPTLEGFLFPETYFFSRVESEQEILSAMIAQYRRVFNADFQKRAEEIGMNEYTVLTLASIVEKETGVDSDRPLIASVFHNRLKRRMRLDSDPTVIYGLVDFNGNLTREHLRKPTPYNTYTRYGLPPTPITNPGRASLHSVLYPADKKYLYFVARGDGSSQFSRTLREHNKAVWYYQKIRKNREAMRRKSKQASAKKL